MSQILITYSSQRTDLKKAYPAQVGALGFQLLSFDFAGNLFEKAFQIRELRKEKERSSLVYLKSILLIPTDDCSLG